MSSLECRQQAPTESGPEIGPYIVLSFAPSAAAVRHCDRVRITCEKISARLSVFSKRWVYARCWEPDISSAARFPSELLRRHGFNKPPLPLPLPQYPSNMAPRYFLQGAFWKGLRICPIPASPSAPLKAYKSYERNPHTMGPDKAKQMGPPQTVRPK